MKRYELRRCPVCGKKPKVTYDILPTQCYCKVYCKPLFGRPHLVASAGQPGEICDRAERDAFVEWNRLADIFQTPQRVAEFTENYIDYHNRMKVWIEKVELLNDVVERLTMENEQLVEDLHDCMHYANPKNNNTCNFCVHDSERGRCEGKDDWMKCRPCWRGVRKEKNDE